MRTPQGRDSYAQDAIENEQAVDRGRRDEATPELVDLSEQEEPGPEFSPEHLAKILQEYEASPKVLSDWDAMWNGFDLAEWTVRASNAICYTPQAAEVVREQVFFGTSGRDGFLYKVATGKFELRTLEKALNYLRQSFRTKHVDDWRKNSPQTTIRGPDIEELCRQVNGKYGTRLKRRTDLEQFLRTVKGLGWEIDLIGGETLRLEDLRLNGSGPTEVVTRESPGRIPMETGDDDANLSPEDTATGTKTQNDFDTHYEVGAPAEKRQSFWNGKDRVAEAAIRGVFFSLVGEQVTATTPASGSNAAVKRWIGEALLCGGFDATLGSMLGFSTRHIRRLRKDARRTWRLDLWTQKNAR